MNDAAILVEDLGKQYRIGGQQQQYSTLRETIVSAAKRVIPWRSGKSHRETIWALKHVSFEVKPGEVVGIIGRNGAGKSTLLKLLAHITEPTEGRISLRGRVGSLLEVGTGFHPELSGRDNIYLNGAILGMRRAEIERKFDEIVDFAEIEKFLDTPVKRYSSGMYVRLAFAVAAHLEPEILLIDEVLAVGDAEFQKKCLGKMSEVAQKGRTVFFVSHNMQAIQSLCNIAFLFDKGQFIQSGNVQSVVRAYLSDRGASQGELVWPKETAPGNTELTLLSVRITSSDGKLLNSYSSNQDIYIDFSFVSHTLDRGLCVGYDLLTPDGITILRSYQTDLSPEEWPELTIGLNRWRCKLPGKLLNAGEYYICPKIGIHNLYWIVNGDEYIKFDVVLDHGVSPLWNSLQVGNRPGVIAPILQWSNIASPS